MDDATLVGSLFATERGEDDRRAASSKATEAGEEKSSTSISNGPQQDIRIAMIGNVDSGKSTLIGVLCSGNLDDGRGLARSRVFTHKHEGESGRTSAISHQLIGFNTKSEQVFVGMKKGKMSKTYWSELVKRTSKNILLIDLCGHRKYLKTTIFGLTGLGPHYAIVLVGSNMGVPRMTREHIGIACALKIPIVVVVTKVDICPPNIFKETMTKLKKILRMAKKTPFIVNKKAKVSKAVELISTSLTTCPVFITSNVNGRGISELREFLGHLEIPRIGKQDILARTTKKMADCAIAAPTPPTDDGKEPEETGAVFTIDSTFNVSGVGVVVSGTVRCGTIKVNDQLILGPNKVGVYMRVLVRSIHINRCNSKSASAGSAASFNIRAVSRKDSVDRDKIRHGMVLLSPSYDEKRRTTREFEAEILILHHQTTCSKGYSPIIHCGVVRQAAAIMGIKKIGSVARKKGNAKKKKKKKKVDESVRDDDAGTAAKAAEAGDEARRILRTGDRALVRFRFMYYPEFVSVGDPMLFREGRAKGIGKITRRIS